MSSVLDQQLQQSLDRFVADVHALSRQAAVDAVARVLGSGRGGTHPAARVLATRALRAAGAPAPGPRKARAAAVGPERATARQALLVDKVVGALQGFPEGASAAQLAGSLGWSRRTLLAQLRRMISDGQIRVTGAARATRYRAA